MCVTPRSILTQTFRHCKTHRILSVALIGNFSEFVAKSNWGTPPELLVEGWGIPFLWLKKIPQRSKRQQQKNGEVCVWSFSLE